ncbi:MAG TPA: hypothetical protein VIY72_06825, partial [Acidimicrobiales bacterium]
GPYERLALLLAEVIRTGETPVEIGRRTGLTVEGPATATSPEAALEEVMARNGFEPELRRRGDEIDVLLHACPFVSTALADPDVVCELHRGIAIGAAERVGGLVVDDLERKDPRRAPCRLRAHLDPDIATP